MATKTYKVVGTAPILDHQPGEEFTADLSDVEDFLIGIGGLAIVESTPEPVEPPEVPPAEVPAPKPKPVKVITRDADGH